MAVRMMEEAVMALVVAVDAPLVVMSGTCLSCWPWFLEWGR